MFLPLHQIGCHLANGFGFNGAKHLQEACEKLSDNHRLQALLAGILNILAGWHDERLDADEPSDGMLAALRAQLPPRVRIAAHLATLSPRARMALERSGKAFVDEINLLELSWIRGCGPATTNEIAKWAKGLGIDLDQPGPMYGPAFAADKLETDERE